MIDTEDLRVEIESIRASAGPETAERVRQAVRLVVRELPKRLETLELHGLAFDLIGGVEDQRERRDLLFEFLKSLPHDSVFGELGLSVAGAAIEAADLIDEKQRRITELTRIAADLPPGPETLELRAQAWRLALGLPEKPRFVKPDLEEVAKELPKSSDYSFYQRYTLLGVAARMPNDEDLVGVYKEGIKLAIEAAAAIEEPFYRKYALIAVSRSLRKGPPYEALYKRAIDDAYRASAAIRDPFAREVAFTDLISEVPKTPSFRKILMELLEQALAFFTAKRWIEDIDIYDVVDFVLSAEELGMKESKKRRFLREKYAHNLSVEIEKFGFELNDIRFINVLAPYTHVWVKPKELRETVKAVVDHLEELRKKYHGREILRPAFVGETAMESERVSREKGPAAPGECISIDLGATNTVIMRKKPGSQPEFVELGPLSRSYDNVSIVPTVLSSEVNAIGAEVTDPTPIINIKQLLLDGNANAVDYMERFLKVLHASLRKTVSSSGWFNIFSPGLADVVYITVPVGFTGYRKTIEGLAARVFRGVKVEIIEEPLAAAVGYQVAEEREKIIMVMDFGGATLDTMVLRLSLDEVHVVAKPEKAQVLGGHDVDVWLASHLAAKAGLATEEPPYSLITRAEEIKIALSRAPEVPFEWEGSEVGTVTREEFEEVLDGHGFYRLVDRSISYILRKAEKVGIKKERIEAVLLTGGSSQIPSFKEKVGDVFPGLRKKNLIYDHSPLSAVAQGAAFYGAKEVIDRHLGMAYALKYATVEREELHSYSIVFEKGESLPIEKTYRMTPANKLGEQSELLIELFEVPDPLIVRKWVREEGVEYLKQELAETKGAVLNGLKTVTVALEEPLSGDILVTLRVAENGSLLVRHELSTRFLDSGLRLQ